MLNRNLAIGFCVSLALHSVGAWWALGLVAKPLPPVVAEKKLVRTVKEQIELPKPKPKPAEIKPPEPPKADDAPKAAEATQPKPIAAPRRTAQPKSTQPAAKAASDEPAPLVLSKTYGDAGGEGVAVQTGKDDVLGDPGVQANEDNVRRRPPADPAPPPKAAEDTEQAAPRKIEIVQARPKGSCDRYIQWPEGAEMGGRVVEVTLQLEIGEDGAVRKVKVLRGAGEPFDGQAMRDIRQCPFAAGSRDGKPMTSKIAFVVEFRPR